MKVTDVRILIIEIILTKHFKYLLCIVTVPPCPILFRNYFKSVLRNKVFVFSYIEFRMFIILRAALVMANDRLLSN
jgi:hypothetical protein